jgi:hypothetical protein
MHRKMVATSLFVSFLAMATSGLMMFFIEKPSFTIQMHPVHKLFGLLMVISIIGHLYLNYRALLNHLKTKSIATFGAVLIVILILLYGVSLNNKVPKDLAVAMDALAAQVEARER